jgi:hypothetical protein
LDTGSLTVQNSRNFQLILQFPFAGTINEPSATMPAFYRFLCCIPEQDDFDTLGTDARDTLLAITAQRTFAGNPQNPVNGFVTYDNTSGGFVLPAPTQT